SPVLQQLADLQHILLLSHEGGGDKIDSLLQAEEDVLRVLLGDSGQLDPNPRNVDPFSVFQHAGVDHPADNLIPPNFHDRKLDQSVVDQDGGTGANILRQSRVGD